MTYIVTVDFVVVTTDRQDACQQVEDVLTAVMQGSGLHWTVIGAEEPE